MTNELKEVVEKIDVEFKDYFKYDSSIKTIFVAGSMAKPDYQDRKDNDYDIRAIADTVTREQVIKFEEFLKQLSNRLTTEDIVVGYSTLVGPVNHKVSFNKKNILIHAMIHRKDQMDDFLPVTHKYQYGDRYRIIFGEDTLKRFQDVRYNLDELLNAHEGLRYCIDMLEKREYRYLSWDTEENKCEFNYHVVPMDDDIVLENCFYATNKFINNAINYCKWYNYDIPEDKMIFSIRLLGRINCTNDTLFLLHGLFTKNEEIVSKMFDNPLEETIKILKIFEGRVNYLNEIFPKKEQEFVKTKKIKRN